MLLVAAVCPAEAEHPAPGPEKKVVHFGNNVIQREGVGKTYHPSWEFWEETGIQPFSSLQKSYPQPGSCPSFCFCFCFVRDLYVALTSLKLREKPTSASRGLGLKALH